MFIRAGQGERAQGTAPAPSLFSKNVDGAEHEVSAVSGHPFHVALKHIIVRAFLYHTHAHRYS